MLRTAHIADAYDMARRKHTLGHPLESTTTSGIKKSKSSGGPPDMNARRLAKQRGPQPEEGDQEAPEARHPQGWPDLDVLVRQQRPRMTPPSSVTPSGRHF